MPPLKQVKRREFMRKLRRLGFHGPFPGGKHRFMQRGALKIRVPNPHSTKEVGLPIVEETLRVVGISEKEWEDL